MISIARAHETDTLLLANIGKQSFVESRGHSTSAAVINEYVSETFSLPVMQQELRDLEDNYHIIYYNDQPAGYSEIIFDAVHLNISLPPGGYVVICMDRK